MEVDDGVAPVGVGERPVGCGICGVHPLILLATVAAMTKWEYLTAPVLVHSTKQILDNFGSEGWELVQIVPGMNPENLVAYFKRPVG